MGKINNTLDAITGNTKMLAVLPDMKGNKMDLIKAHLPKTYYADLDSKSRIKIFVEHWRRLVKINQELQAQVDSLRAQPEGMPNSVAVNNMQAKLNKISKEERFYSDGTQIEGTKII